MLLFFATADIMMSTKRGFSALFEDETGGAYGTDDNDTLSAQVMLIYARPFLRLRVYLLSNRPDALQDQATVNQIQENDREKRRRESYILHVGPRFRQGHHTPYRCTNVQVFYFYLCFAFCLSDTST